MTKEAGKFERGEGEKEEEYKSIVEETMPLTAAVLFGEAQDPLVRLSEIKKLGNLLKEAESNVDEKVLTRITYTLALVGLVLLEVFSLEAAEERLEITGTKLLLLIGRESQKSLGRIPRDEYLTFINWLAKKLFLSDIINPLFVGSQYKKLSEEESITTIAKSLKWINLCLMCGRFFLESQTDGTDDNPGDPLDNSDDPFSAFIETLDI